MPVAETTEEAAMNEKVAEIVGIMFQTLQTALPEKDDKFIFELTQKVMDDINNDGAE